MMQRIAIRAIQAILCEREAVFIAPPKGGRMARNRGCELLWNTWTSPIGPGARSMNA